jgi:4'-phosphopantetheinyl transferase
VSGDEVKVVYAALDQPEGRIAELAQHLSADEHARAAAFVFERDRDRFIAGRGMLRELLAEAVGERPDRLSFHYGKHGKPALSGRPIRFNLSHSEGRAVYVFSAEREVGVDLERIRPVQQAMRIAERLFTPREVAHLAGLDGEEQQAAFFRAWTRREAHGKAIGAGLGAKLDTMAGWTLRCLVAAPGFVATLAVEGDGWQLWESPWPIEGDGCER